MSMMLKKYTDLRYRTFVSTEKQLSEALSCSEFEYIYSPVGFLSDNTVDQKKRIIAVPSVFGDVTEEIQFARNNGFFRALAHTIGHISAIRAAGMAIHGGFRLNITNSAALEQYQKLGLTDAILSFELSLNRIKSLNPSLSTFPKGVIVHGKLPLMLLRNPESFGLTDDGISGLTDRKGKFVPIYKNQHYGNEAELLNPITLALSDRMSEFSFLDFAVLMPPTEESVPEILNMYKNGVSPAKNYNEYTRGLYY